MPPLDRPSVYIGFDPREAAAFAVARDTMRKRTNTPIPIKGLVLSELQQYGLYTRPLEYKQSACDGPIMWDVLSDAPMSTQHANARFLVPYINGPGLALFTDGDVLVRGNIGDLFWKAASDPSKAVWCVHHDYQPTAQIKMDGQLQTKYGRKFWSSVMLFNCNHPANKALTLEAVNTLPGRDLHRFCWLEDSEIGEFGPEWNWLAGYSSEAIDPKLVHFTSGTPDMKGYANAPYADEWRNALNDWAQGALSLPA